MCESHQVQTYVCPFCKGEGYARLDEETERDYMERTWKELERLSRTVAKLMGSSL